MRRITILTAITLTLAACDRDIYTVRMESSETGFDRHLDIVRVDASGTRKRPPAEVLDPILQIYGAPGPLADPGFAASFENVTPQDIGGRGIMARSTTSLGSVRVYLERFRGDDNLVARVERVQDAASIFAEVVLGWLDATLENEPAWPAFRESLAGRLETDARNLALTVWLAKNSGRTMRATEGEDEHVLLRVIAYLHEHGYISDDDLVTAVSGSDQPDLMAALVGGWLARGMKLDDAGASEALAAISTDEALGASWDAYAASPGATRLLTDWAERAGVAMPEDPNAPEAGAELLNHLTTVATGSEPTDAGAEDEVTISLACAAEPTLTNGEWSADTREITWMFDVEPSAEVGYLLPALAAAVWAEPDDAFQTERFGSVVLSGDALASYCAWRGRLGEAQGARWDAMLAGVHGRDEARAAIESYELGEVAQDAVTGRTLLLDVLSE